MSAAAGLFGASSVLGGIGAYMGGQSQAAGYRDAANQANQTLTNTNNQARSDWAPYTGAGSNAANKLNSYINDTPKFTMSDFYNDPGYQFTLQQGTNAVNNSAAARGGLLSGGAAKGLANYTTGLANQTYGDAWNRYMQNRQQGFNELTGVAGLGENAQNVVSNVGLQTGLQQSKNTFGALTGAANASAAGLQGLFGGAGGALNSLGGYYAMKNGY